MDAVRIKNFYIGRSVFVTGASGFIGKVLVEKLLRSFPGLDKVYILVRPKKGKTPEERVEQLTSIPLFETLKRLHPTVIQEKLKVISGDVTTLKLGISEDDRKLLIDNVSIIFHVAASVRFDDHLKEAILMNTRGTREVITLALEMKKLEAFLHVSTTYCNIDRKEVGEQLYPAHGDWKKSIELAENMDEYVLQILTAKYTDALPNTYVFTKSLAEHVVYDMCKDRIPAIVFRPSIVISTMSDPVPGWIDNFNGPVGLLVASGKGIMRTCLADVNLKADYMPVDIVVRALLLAAWQKAITIDMDEKLDVSFYNCSNNNMYTLTFQEMADIGTQVSWETPMSSILWFPGFSGTTCKQWYYIKFMLLQLLPAMVIDLILRIAKRKPMLVKIQRRIHIANMALAHFITNHWSFLNYKCLELDEKLLPEEMHEFGYNRESVNIYEYFRNCVMYGPTYLLIEENPNLEKAKVNMYRMYVLHKFVTFSFYGFLFWFFVYKLDSISIISNAFHNICEAIMLE